MKITIVLLFLCLICFLYLNASLSNDLDSNSSLLQHSQNDFEEKTIDDEVLIENKETGELIVTHNDVDIEESIPYEEKIKKHERQIESYMFCNDDMNHYGKLEPTIHEIFNTVIGNDIAELINPEGLTEKLKDKIHFNNSMQMNLFQTMTDFFYWIFNIIAFQEVPLLKVMSNGIHKIDMKDISFNDIYLYQENFYSLSYICQLDLVKENKFLFSSLCQCWTSESIPAKSLGYDSNAAFCSSRPCSDKSNYLGSCKVRVDPFRKSCIRVTSLYPLDKSIVTYNHSIPTLKPYVQYLSLFIESTIETSFDMNFEQLSRKMHTKSNFMNQVIWFMFYVDELLYDCLSNIPFYFFNLIMGMYLLYHSNAIASSKLFQYIFLSSIGIFFIFFYLLWTIYRASSKTLQEYIPSLILTVAPTSMIAMGVSTFFLSNSYVLSTYFNYCWLIWSTGYPTNIRWFGKAIAAFAFLCCMIIINMGGFFAPKTSSLEFLKFSLKLLAIFFLMNSTSSYELSILLGSIVACWDEIQYALDYISMISEGYMTIPTYEYTGNKLSMDKYAIDGETHTQKALKDLQLYLKKNPNESNKILNRLEQSSEDRHDEVASRIRNFISGDYQGRPFYDAISDDNDSNEKPSLWRNIFVFLVIGIVIGFIGVACILFFDNEELNRNIINIFTKVIHYLPNLKWPGASIEL